MRILDRYICKKFIAPFIYCMVSFIMLFVIGDLFENMGDFLETSNWILIIIKYYLLFIPSTINYITAIAVLLALLSSLGMLQKSNEIAAMRSAGISIYRIALPLLLLSFIISLGVLYLNEMVAPNAFRESQLLKKQASGKAFDEILSDLNYYNPLSNRSYYFKSFNPENNTATEVTIHELRPNGKPYRRITANEAAWLDGKWWLFNGFIYTFPLTDIPIKKVLKKESFDFEVQPLDMIESEDRFSQFGYLELKESLERKSGFPLLVLRPILVQLHQKLALPIACFIMGLLGVSFGLRGGKGGMLAGVGISLALGFLYFAFFSITGAMGNQGYLQPWLAAWLSNIIFGIIGLIFLFRLNRS
jgi:LPS export ABC transporter permease LptG